MKSKFYDKIILSIEDSIEKQKQIRKELRIKNTGITEPLESEKFFSNYHYSNNFNFCLCKEK